MLVRPSTTSPASKMRCTTGAFTAAGSVITQDVPQDSMAFGRAKQVNKPGLAATFRASKRKS